MRRRLIAAATLAFAAAAAAALAQERARLSLSVGEGELVRLEREADTVFVANPAVADVQVAGPRSIFLFGAAPGRTTFFALDAEGEPIAERDIRVEPDAEALAGVLAARFPDARIRVTAAAGSVLLEGATSTPQEAEAVLSVAEAALGEAVPLVNRLTVDSPVQVNLRVRVAEVSRNVDERLGINWNALLRPGEFVFRVATGGGIFAGDPARFRIPPAPESYGTYDLRFDGGDVDLNVLIDALSREGLARTLAEPNLTAVSGETASFTAGGEFPIPIAQDDDTISIEFKPFGVILNFVPTVLSSDRIALRVAPEVSELTPVGAVTVGDLQIPALTVRRVETTVELASGQSLVIGGLLQQSAREAVETIPGLGDLPVLGGLFTSTAYRSAETELIVTVTPYIVRPTRPGEAPALLGARGVERSLETLLLGRAPEAGARLPGQTGFAF